MVRIQECDEQGVEPDEEIVVPTVLPKAEKAVKSSEQVPAHRPRVPIIMIKGVKQVMYSKSIQNSLLMHYPQVNVAQVKRDYQLNDGKKCSACLKAKRKSGLMH